MSITSNSSLVMIAKMFFHFPAIFRNLKIPSKQAKHGSNFYHSCGRQNVVVAMPGVNDLSQTCLKIMSTTMGKKKNHAISISQTRKGMLLAGHAATIVQTGTADQPDILIPKSGVSNSSKCRHSIVIQPILVKLHIFSFFFLLKQTALPRVDV